MSSATSLATELVKAYQEALPILLNADAQTLHRLNKNEQFQVIQAFLTNKPKFELDPNFFSIFGLKTPLSCLRKHRPLLQTVYRIVQLQSKRKTLFKEHVSNVYTMSFTGFAFDNHIDSIVDRARLVMVTTLFFKLPKETVREHVLRCRTVHISHPALTKHMDVLLRDSV